MDRPDQACGEGSGTLPCPCATLAYPYIPVQGENPPRYQRAEALQTGTLFPGLNLPFAVDELGLYLTTHPNDQEVLDLYWTYVQLANEGRQKYQKLYGPLLQTDCPTDGSYAWLKDPWPWERGGSE